MRTLILDNYDSFTYNLFEYLRCTSNDSIDVIRNDEITFPEIDNYQRIVLSPGPGIPNEAGILKELIKMYGEKKAILGICLGHQAIAEVYGGEIKMLKKVFHGVSTKIINLKKEKSILKNLPEKFEAGRYHSWIVNDKTLPECFEITCLDAQGIIMGIRHKNYPAEGIQFHPESILTPLGMQIIKIGLQLTNEKYFRKKNIW